MIKLFIFSFAFYFTSFIPSCEPIIITPDKPENTVIVAPADNEIIGTDYEIDPSWKRVRLEFNINENLLFSSNNAGAFCPYDYGNNTCNYQTGNEKVLTYYLNPPSNTVPVYGRFIIWLRYGTVKHVATHNFNDHACTEWDQGMEFVLDGVSEHDIDSYIEDYEKLYFDVYYVDEHNDDF